MGLPTIQKTWTITANNRIPFVSLNGTMASYFFGMKAFLKAHGYTVKGSCNGTTGAMDAVDRWVSAADVTTRGNGAANAQSWIVLTDANGVDLLLTYQGATDDVARISFSQGALFVVAGTPNQQPTATDEAVMSSGATLINATASQDRVWFGWVDSTSKLCRFAIARNGAFVGTLWGLELTSTSALAGANVVWSPRVWGFAWLTNASLLPTSNAVAGAARVTASSVGTTCQMTPGCERYAANTFPWANKKLPLQGATGYPAIPIMIGSLTANARGKFALLFDHWAGRMSGGADGDLYGTMSFIGVAGYAAAGGSGCWPWDGVTSPVLL
jgi:hypothetical protein